MKEFKTLEEVHIAIEQWAIDLNYHTSENSEKQYYKVLAELGEVADEIAKEREEELKLELGDLGVTLIVLALQQDGTLEIKTNNTKPFEIRTLLYHIHNALIVLKSTDLAFNLFFNLCYVLKLDALECLTLAYNKIEQRRVNGQLKVINGTIQK